MIEYINECCDCATGAYPCLGSSCALRSVPHYICDACGMDVGDDPLYDYDGSQLCKECVLEMLPKVEGDD